MDRSHNHGKKRRTIKNQKRTHLRFQAGKIDLSFSLIYFLITLFPKIIMILTPTRLSFKFSGNDCFNPTSLAKPDSPNFVPVGVSDDQKLACGYP
jgi:hypothetical protein